MQTHVVLDYPVHVDSSEGLIASLDKGLQAGRHQHVVTLNPEMLMFGEQDKTFGALLKSADLVLPDGAGIVWALKRRGIHLKRVPGIEFSQALLAKAAREGLPVALLGAQPDVNEAAVKNLKQTYPGLTIVYAHHGFFASAEERAQIAQACADARPNYVFVALGVPHQERWIQEFKAIFQEPTVFVGVGGSFDIWSGLKQRAHPLFLKWHLEWLYRITSEPFRIKRVYKTLPTFALKVLFQDSRSASS